MSFSNIELASHFHSLHTPGDPLILPNAWDAASAAMVERAGACAIATTSAGMSWAAGLPDGDQLERSHVIAALAGITTRSLLPINVDIETGYADSPAEISETITEMIDAGAAGVNLEDGLLTLESFLERISVARRTADARSVPVFINARTDVFLRGTAEDNEESLVQEAIRRGRLCVSHGADGIFVPGAVSANAISAMVDGIPAPVNVMVGHGSLPVATLRELGVARISLGSGIAQAAYATVQRATNELLREGTYGELEGALDYAELNAMFSVRE